MASSTNWSHTLRVEKKVWGPGDIYHVVEGQLTRQEPFFSLNFSKQTSTDGAEEEIVLSKIVELLNG